MSESIEDKVVGGILVLIVLFLIFTGVFLAMRYEISEPSVYLYYEKVCMLEYGGDWIYEKDQIFGKTCVELDFISFEIINRTKLKLSDEEITNKYCNSPSFWNLKVWESGCVWHKESGK